MNLLFTSVGRRVELMRAFKNLRSKRHADFRLLGTDVDPLAPALQEVDRYFLVPRNTSESYVPTLLDICKRASIDAVFPLIDPDIPILAKNKTSFEAVGTKVAVVEERASHVSADKWEAYRFFSKLGLETPHSWLPGDASLADAPFPLFIKPRFGSAAVDTYKVNNSEELQFFSRYVPNPIIQEYLPGPEITSDIICDMHGNVIAVVSRKRIAVRGGEVTKGVTVHCPTIEEACLEIAASLPACGPITAQCMMKDDKPHFIEINARLGGGIPLAIAAGVNVPELLLNITAGKRIDRIGSPGYQLGLCMTRFDDSFFIPAESISK